MSQYINKIRTDKGDLQIDYNALANLPTISNPNLLINSDFRNPVNQRGQTTYKSDASNFTRIFTVDRWNMQNGCECTVNTASITLKGDSAASGTQIFCQVLETLPTDDYTLQVKVKSMSNGANVQVSNSSSQAVLTESLYTGINKFTVSNTDVRFVSVNLGNDSVIEIEWIKLECGTTATPFTPRLHAEEVLLCLRYYQTVKCRLTMTVYSTERADGTYYFQVPMIAMPSSVTVNSATYFDPTTEGFIEAGDTVANWAYVNNKCALIRMDKNANDTFIIGQSRNALIDLSIDAEIR